jgi:hypothetical protein
MAKMKHAETTFNVHSSITCPRCGEQGSVQAKPIKNRYGNIYRYLYVAHYKFDQSKPKSTKVTWCYLGGKTKSVPN